MSQETSRWRRGRLAGVLGTAALAYAGVSYVLGQLGEERERRRKDEKSRDNLRLRFAELLDNSNFTVMMLLPNVASQIMTALDVEGITTTLQQKSALAKASPPTASLTDSYDKLTPSEIHINGTSEPEPPQRVHDIEKLPEINGEHEQGDATANGLNGEVAASQELGSSALGLSTALPPMDTSAVLSEQPHDPRSKLELWQEIKVLAVTRIVTALYLVSILNLQTIVTLNLLGRADYLTSVIDLARGRGIGGQVVVDDIVAAYAALPPTASDTDAETDQKFLTFSWYLLHKGWPLLVERVRMAVDELVGPLNLKAQITYDDLCGLFERLRKRIDEDALDKPFSFLPIYFPQTEEDEVLTLSSGGIPPHRAFVDARLRTLLDETKAFLSSNDGRQVQKLCLDASFTKMTNSLESLFKDAPLPGQAATSLAEAKQSSRLTVVGGRSARLANLLPVMAKTSHTILEGFPNEYVEELKDVPELKAFAAIVFSSFR